MGKTRLKVGIFVTVSFFILAAAVLWLAGSRFFRPVDNYHIFFHQSVSGLLPGAAVEYLGVTVGKVEGVHLTHETPPRAAVTIALEPGTPIRTDTSAHLIGSLVTGIRFVELTGGSAEAPPLEFGGTIPVSTGEFEQFRDQASEIATHLLLTLQRIEQDLLNDENRAAFSSFLRNASHLSETLSTSLDDVSTPATRASLKAMVNNLAQAAAGIKSATEAINDIRSDIYNEGRATIAQIRQTAAVTAKLAGETREVVQHAASLTKHADQLVMRFDGVVADNNKELNQLLVNLSATSRHLKETINTLKDDPSELVWGRNIPEKEIPDK
ncbi:MAG: MCE family protein [Deltaproteobacteria bacterium]|nr:MCE family protein [Deltaproteobacteria bacterium]